MEKLEVRVILQNGEINETKDVVTQGEFITFDKIRMFMSAGSQVDLYRSGIKSTVHSAKAIDTAAAFNAFFPEIVKRLSVDNIIDLTPEDFLPFVKAYNEYIYPWLQKYQKLIEEFVKEENA